MSNHDFHKTPAKDEIIYRLRRMQELGADIPKIALMPPAVRTSSRCFLRPSTWPKNTPTARSSR